MEIFYNRVRPNYEEVASYGPRWWLKYREMDANYRFAGWTLDLMADFLERLIRNNFPAYADEETLRKFEDLFGIEYDGEVTLEERRRTVLAYYSGTGKLSRSVIQAIVKAYTGQDCDVYWSGERLIIAFKNNSGTLIKMPILLNVLDRRMPAHIDWRLCCVKTVCLGISAKRDPWKVSFPQAGTRPNTNIGLAMPSFALELRPAKRGWRTKPPKAGASGETGAYPDTSTGLEIAKDALILDVHGDGHKSDSPMAGSGKTGTYPDTSMALRLSGVDVNVRPDAENYAVQYGQAGTKPDTNTGLRIGESDIELSVDREACLVQSETAGTIPDTSVGLGRSKSSLTARADRKSYETESPMAGASEEAGTAPEISTAADINSGSLNPKVSTEKWQVDYALCGDDF